MTSLSKLIPIMDVNETTETAISGTKPTIRSNSRIAPDFQNVSRSQDAGEGDELIHSFFDDGALDYALCTLDPEGCVITWNRGAERLFGFRAEEILGHSFECLYPLNAISRHEPIRELNVASQQGICDVQETRIRKDGRLINVYVVITALRDGDCTLHGYAMMAHDLTEHRRSRRENPRYKYRLQSILETVVDAIIIFDERGIIDSVNPAGERMFGYQADEVIGQNVYLLMSPTIVGEENGDMPRYSRKGQANISGISREVQARRKDGSCFPADLSVSEFYDGRPLFTGILRDISDRKVIEAEVLQIAEAEQRRIGQKLNDDARQQLSALIMIARKVANSLGTLQTQDPHLADIQAKVDRLVSGLRDANLSLREVTQSSVPLYIETHGLHDALAELAAQFRELHSVSCHFSAEGSVEVNDGLAATYLYRITQEAVNSSFMHGAAKEISIRLRNMERMVVLEVADDGIGIFDQRETLGRGLQIMAYRAGLIGAVLTVRKGEAGGTVASCILPAQ
jgi:PAS domain S-box-containing protein